MPSSPLFESTSSDRPKILTISFASDPNASLGAQLKSHDQGLTEDMFNPSYASILRLLDGDTLARKSGVAVGDCIIAVNGEGFRRFPPDHDESQLDDVTAAMDDMPLDNNNNNSNIDEDGKKLKARVITREQNGEAYALLLSKIKEIKKSVNPQNSPLSLSLERHGWDSQVHSWHRFLAARDHDVPASMMMMQQHDQWKKTTFPIDLTNDTLQNVLKSKSVCEIDIENHGIKDGYIPPTVYVNFSKLQALGKNTSCSEDVVKAFVIFTEMMLARAPNPRHPKTCQFIDLTGVSISSGLRVDILKQVYAAFEPNYPETLLKMVMYPVSKVVASTATMMLSFVNENTRKKFIITDDLERVCKELGWDKNEVDDCGGVTKYMHKHEKHGSSLIFD